ncbi:MAG: SMC-Scp complex subunit ScpB [Gammaproteobacteria bacterium]
MSNIDIKSILEATLLASGKPMTIDALLKVFADNETPDRGDMRTALDELENDYTGRGIELVRVASGYRIQVSQSMEPWVSRLVEEKTAKYSRALLETIALIAYRQPITRGEIEDVRGVSVSTYIIKTLLEREWVRIVGHRDLPGKPAMYGTTRQFLDYFGLQTLDELPTLMELRSLDTISAELDLVLPGEAIAIDNESDDSVMEEGIDAVETDLVDASSENLSEPAAETSESETDESSGLLH